MKVGGGAYLYGLTLGRALSGTRRLSARAVDRVWLALLDLDGALEARIGEVERRLEDLRDGVDDWRRANER